MAVFFRECLAPDELTSDKGLFERSHDGTECKPKRVCIQRDLQTVRSGLVCRAVQCIQGEQKPAKEDACREGNDSHNTKDHHAVMCLGITRYNVGPDLGPRCKASESVQDLASVAESENEQGSDFHYLQLVKRDHSSKQQTDHEHHQIGRVLFHWIEFSFARGLK